MGGSEDAAFWTSFLRRLTERGLRGVERAISDAHLGVQEAIRTVLAVPIVSAAAWFAFFWAIWGTPNPAAPYGQATQSAWSHLKPAIRGLLFDQQFGLIAAAPVYAAAGLGFFALGRGHRRLAVELALICAVYTATVGTYRMWWGGHSAPARFLVAMKDLDDAEAGADGDGAAEQAAHLLRPGVGGDVVVLRHQAQQLVAHAAAGPQRLVAGVAQLLYHLDGELTFRHGSPGPPRPAGAAPRVPRSAARSARNGVVPIADR